MLNNVPSDAEVAGPWTTLRMARDSNDLPFVGVFRPPGRGRSSQGGRACRGAAC